MSKKSWFTLEEIQIKKERNKKNMYFYSFLFTMVLSALVTFLASQI
ncbi:hypothetical protein [Peribacillus deserti]|nr:hypothetical protein [Peribacillus deserti]